MPFSNVNLSESSACFGPTGGRIYSIDHVTDTMLIKTYPGGTLVSTVPLDTSLLNEVLELSYDGYYFWTLSRLGSGVGIGIVINKWFLNNTTLVKQTGLANEINLINGSTIYASEAFCVQRYETNLTTFASVGVTQVTLASALFLELGDSIYFGPSTAAAGERTERTITGISGNTVFFTVPLTIQFNNLDKVIYRKNIWVFNNSSGTDITSGSLIQINSYTGNILTSYSSSSWRNVTAANIASGNLAFVRGSQLLTYRPFGVNAGYQSSSMLLNIKNDNNTIIKVFSLEIDSTTIHKLQKESHIFNNTTFVYDDEVGANANYHVDTEIIASKVQNITFIRDRSTFLGGSSQSDFTVIVTDQYDLPILGRSISITEDDSSGSIPGGFNSFTTNALGRGITRYNSGAAPTNRPVLITVRDVGTNLRLNTYVEQFQNILNIGLVDQENTTPSRTLVDQDRLSFHNLLDQTTNIVGAAFIDQDKPTDIEIPIDQVIQYYSMVLEQLPFVTGLNLIDQNIPIEEITTVIQYNFLIFALPAPYSRKNPVDTNILLRIIGFSLTPLNTSTLIFKVNGVDVTSQIVVTPFGGGLQIDYNPALNFNYSSTVSVYLEIEDTNLPPRTISTFYTFDTVGDFKAPFLETVYPPDNSINNLPTTEVFAIIADLETGIDLSSIEMYVGGKQVTPTTSYTDSNSVKVSYQTTDAYPYEADLTAAIRASDIEGNTFFGSWNFKIKPSAGVLFINNNPEECSVLVPVDTDVCIEVFGLEDGVNLESLTFNVDNKEVTYVLKPKVYRKE